MRAMEDLEVVAGNGLLHRRVFLRGGAAFAAAMTGYMLSDSVAAQQLADDPWSTRPGTPDPGVRRPVLLREKRLAHAEQSRRGSRAPSTRARRTICSTARSRPTGCTSSSRTPATPDIDPGEAPAGDPRPGEEAAGLHARCAECAIRWCRAWRLSNAAATARRSSQTSRCRATCRRCTAWSPAPSGPASCSPPCSRKRASTRRRNGSSPKAPTRWR